MPRQFRQLGRYLSRNLAIIAYLIINFFRNFIGLLKFFGGSEEHRTSCNAMI